MKLYIESKLNEDINPQFAVINTKTGKYAGDPCLSKEEAMDLAAQDDDRRIFALKQMSYGNVPLKEWLNDRLLEDDEFVNFILRYRDRGFDADDIEDTVAYIVETMD